MSNNQPFEKEFMELDAWAKKVAATGDDRKHPALIISYFLAARAYKEFDTHSVGLQQLRNVSEFTEKIFNQMWDQLGKQRLKRRRR